MIGIEVDECKIKVAAPATNTSLTCRLRSSHDREGVSARVQRVIDTRNALLHVADGRAKVVKL